MFSFDENEYVLDRIAANLLRVLPDCPAPLPTSILALRRLFFFHLTYDAVVTLDGKILTHEEQIDVVVGNLVGFLEALQRLGEKSKHAVSGKR